MVKSLNYLQFPMKNLPTINTVPKALNLCYTLPLSALKTQAMAKKPIPTEAKPQPATSSYLKAPRAISAQPTQIIINVAQARTVFLFIPMFVGFGSW